MRKIKNVTINGFWGDKTVNVDFDEEVNFLIGINGSGKTTIINLISACLDVDVRTLNKIEFSKIKIEFSKNRGDGNHKTYIEVEKTSTDDLSFSTSTNIKYRIKRVSEGIITVDLDELDNSAQLQMHYDFSKRYHRFKFQKNDDIKKVLNSFVNFTWLSIHRAENKNYREDKSYDFSIDRKIDELTFELTKYFGILNKRYSEETERFQKNIFLSLISDGSEKYLRTSLNSLDLNKDKESIKQIFKLFNLKESDFENILDKHFKTSEMALEEIDRKEKLTTLTHASLLSTLRLHSIVKEWNTLNDTKNLINKPKETFLNELNCLFNKKSIVINKNNELFVKMNNGKIFTISQLSSGEKQLFIILGQALLQETGPHIYIADEPELSLHIEWQEKLVVSIKKINPSSQIIFATHSPDIVSRFHENVINVKDIIR